MQRKLELQRTALPAMRALRAAKAVRGTLADPFRWAEVRRLERAMIPEFERAIAGVNRRLTAASLADAVGIAGLPDQVRGYEDIKLRRAAEYRRQLAARVADFG
jgi:indolepyruvate ferredoxin oxidoreductase